MTLYDIGALTLWGGLFLAPFVWFYVTVRRRQGQRGETPWRAEDHDSPGIP